MATEAPPVPPPEADPSEAPDAADAAGADKPASGQTPRSASSRRRSLPAFYKPEEKEKAPLKIDQGQGSKLKDIPNARFRLAKLRPDDELLTSMHTLFYRRAGTSNKRKKEVLEFSGILYTDEDAKKAEAAKVEEKLSRWHLGLLNRLLDCFDLPKGSGESGQKASKIERAVDFLMKPRILASKNKAEMELKRKEKAKKKQEGIKKTTEKKEKPKVQKRKPGEEPRPRGRPPKKPKTTETENASEAAGKGGKETEGGAPKPAEANGLTEDTVRKEVLKTLQAADVNSLSMAQVFASLTESLGEDVTLWKALIKEVAVQYTKEHTQAEMEGKCENVDQPMEEAKEERKDEGKEENEKEAKDELQGADKVEKVEGNMDVDEVPHEGKSKVVEEAKAGDKEEPTAPEACEPEKANGHV
eukprot:evm.model.scf_4079.1 EVM.evm.TU.scf_4079.1   scf_4079:1623-9280(-)